MGNANVKKRLVNLLREHAHIVFKEVPWDDVLTFSLLKGSIGISRLDLQEKFLQNLDIFAPVNVHEAWLEQVKISLSSSLVVCVEAQRFRARLSLRSPVSWQQDAEAIKMFELSSKARLLREHEEQVLDQPSSSTRMLLVAALRQSLPEVELDFREIAVDFGLQEAPSEQALSCLASLSQVSSRLRLGELLDPHCRESTATFVMKGGMLSCIEPRESPDPERTADDPAAGPRAGPPASHEEEHDTHKGCFIQVPSWRQHAEQSLVFGPVPEICLEMRFCKRAVSRHDSEGSSSWQSPVPRPIGLIAPRSRSAVPKLAIRITASDCGQGLRLTQSQLAHVLRLHAVLLLWQAFLRDLAPPPPSRDQCNWYQATWLKQMKSIAGLASSVDVESGVPPELLQGEAPACEQDPAVELLTFEQHFSLQDLLRQRRWALQSLKHGREHDELALIEEDNIISSHIPMCAANQDEMCWNLGANFARKRRLLLRDPEHSTELYLDVDLHGLILELRGEGERPLPCAGAAETPLGDAESATALLRLKPFSNNQETSQFRMLFHIGNDPGLPPLSAEFCISNFSVELQLAQQEPLPLFDHHGLLYAQMDSGASDGESLPILRRYARLGEVFMRLEPESLLAILDLGLGLLGAEADVMADMDVRDRRASPHSVDSDPRRRVERPRGRLDVRISSAPLRILLPVSTPLSTGAFMTSFILEWPLTPASHIPASSSQNSIGLCAKCIALWQLPLPANPLPPSDSSVWAPDSVVCSCSELALSAGPDGFHCRLATLRLSLHPQIFPLLLQCCNQWGPLFACMDSICCAVASQSKQTCMRPTQSWRDDEAGARDRPSCLKCTVTLHMQSLELELEMREKSESDPNDHPMMAWRLVEQYADFQFQDGLQTCSYSLQRLEVVASGQHLVDLASRAQTPALTISFRRTLQGLEQAVAASVMVVPLWLAFRWQSFRDMVEFQRAYWKCPEPEEDFSDVWNERSSVSGNLSSPGIPVEATSGDSEHDMRSGVPPVWFRRSGSGLPAQGADTSGRLFATLWQALPDAQHWQIKASFQQVLLFIPEAKSGLLLAANAKVSFANTRLDLLVSDFAAKELPDPQPNAARNFQMPSLHHPQAAYLLHPARFRLIAGIERARSDKAPGQIAGLHVRLEVEPLRITLRTGDVALLRGLNSAFHGLAADLLDVCKDVGVLKEIENVAQEGLFRILVAELTWALRAGLQLLPAPLQENLGASWALLDARPFRMEADLPALCLSIVHGPSNATFILAQLEEMALVLERGPGCLASPSFYARERPLPRHRDPESCEGTLNTCSLESDGTGDRELARELMVVGRVGAAFMDVMDIGTAKSTPLLEPVHVSFTFSRGARQIRPSRCDVSWLNANVSLFLIDALVGLFRAVSTSHDVRKHEDVPTCRTNTGSSSSPREGIKESEEHETAPKPPPIRRGLTFGACLRQRGMQSGQDIEHSNKFGDETPQLLVRNQLGQAVDVVLLSGLRELLLDGEAVSTSLPSLNPGSFAKRSIDVLLSQPHQALLKLHLASTPKVQTLPVHARIKSTALSYDRCHTRDSEAGICIASGSTLPPGGCWVLVRRLGGRIMGKLEVHLSSTIFLENRSTTCVSVGPFGTPQDEWMKLLPGAEPRPVPLAWCSAFAPPLLCGLTAILAVAEGAECRQADVEANRSDHHFRHRVLKKRGVLQPLLGQGAWRSMCQYRSMVVDDYYLRGKDLRLRDPGGDLMAHLCSTVYGVSADLHAPLQALFFSIAIEPTVQLCNRLPCPVKLSRLSKRSKNLEGPPTSLLAPGEDADLLHPATALDMLILAPSGPLKLQSPLWAQCLSKDRHQRQLRFCEQGIAEGQEGESLLVTLGTEPGLTLPECWTPLQVHQYSARACRLVLFTQYWLINRRSDCRICVPSQNRPLRHGGVALFPANFCVPPAACEPNSLRMLSESLVQRGKLQVGLCDQRYNADGETLVPVTAPFRVDQPTVGVATAPRSRRNPVQRCFGFSVRPAPLPFYRTLIVEVVRRYTLLNHKKHGLLCCEPGSGIPLELGPGCSAAFDPQSESLMVAISGLQPRREVCAGFRTLFTSVTCGNMSPGASAAVASASSASSLPSLATVLAAALGTSDHDEGNFPLESMQGSSFGKQGYSTVFRLESEDAGDACFQILHQVDLRSFDSDESLTRATLLCPEPLTGPAEPLPSEGLVWCITAVDSHINQGSKTIRFSEPARPSFRLVNRCGRVLELRQDCHGAPSLELPPEKRMNFTWFWPGGGHNLCLRLGNHEERYEIGLVQLHEAVLTAKRPALSPIGALWQEEFQVRTRVHRGCREVHVQPWCRLVNLKGHALVVRCASGSSCEVLLPGGGGYVCLQPQRGEKFTSIRVRSFSERSCSKWSQPIQLGMPLCGHKGYLRHLSNNAVGKTATFEITMVEICKDPVSDFIIVELKPYQQSCCPYLLENLSSHECIVTQLGNGPENAEVPLLPGDRSPFLPLGLGGKSEACSVRLRVMSKTDDPPSVSGLIESLIDLEEPQERNLGLIQVEVLQERPRRLVLRDAAGGPEVRHYRSRRGRTAAALQLGWLIGSATPGRSGTPGTGRSTGASSSQARAPRGASQCPSRVPSRSLSPQSRGPLREQSPSLLPVPLPTLMQGHASGHHAHHAHHTSSAQTPGLKPSLSSAICTSRLKHVERSRLRLPVSCSTPQEWNQSNVTCLSPLFAPSPLQQSPSILHWLRTGSSDIFWHRQDYETAHARLFGSCEESQSSGDSIFELCVEGAGVSLVDGMALQEVAYVSAQQLQVRLQISRSDGGRQLNLILRSMQMEVRESSGCRSSVMLRPRWRARDSVGTANSLAPQARACGKGSAQPHAAPSSTTVRSRQNAGTKDLRMPLTSVQVRWLAPDKCAGSAAHLEVEELRAEIRELEVRLDTVRCFALAQWALELAAHAEPLIGFQSLASEAADAERLLFGKGSAEDPCLGEPPCPEPDDFADPTPVFIRRLLLRRLKIYLSVRFSGKRVSDCQGSQALQALDFMLRKLIPFDVSQARICLGSVTVRRSRSSRSSRSAPVSQAVRAILNRLPGRVKVRDVTATDEFLPQGLHNLASGVAQEVSSAVLRQIPRLLGAQRVLGSPDRLFLELLQAIGLVWLGLKCCDVFALLAAVLVGISALLDSLEGILMIITKTFIRATVGNMPPGLRKEPSGVLGALMDVAWYGFPWHGRQVYREWHRQIHIAHSSQSSAVAGWCLLVGTWVTLTSLCSATLVVIAKTIQVLHLMARNTACYICPDQLAQLGAAIPLRAGPLLFRQGSPIQFSEHATAVLSAVHDRARGTRHRDWRVRQLPNAEGSIVAVQGTGFFLVRPCRWRCLRVRDLQVAWEAHGDWELVELLARPVGSGLPMAGTWNLRLSRCGHTGKELTLRSCQGALAAFSFMQECLAGWAHCDEQAQVTPETPRFPLLRKVRRSATGRASLY